MEDVVIAGPYVSCAYKAPPVEQKTFLRRLCKNKSCDLYNTKLPKNAKFCQSCGKAVQVEKKVVSSENNLDTFLAKVRADLAAVNSKLVFPDKQLANAVAKTGHHFWHVSQGVLAKGPSHKEGVVHSVTQDKIAQDIDMFASMFKNEYTILTNAYGAENVSLHWGILVYLPQ